MGIKTLEVGFDGEPFVLINGRYSVYKNVAYDTWYAKDIPKYVMELIK